MNIAICVIAYNRLDSLKRCISFLEKADYPEPVKLYISVDKSKTSVVEDYAKAYHWEHGEYEAVLHEKNLGLRTHILGCGNLTEKHDAVIIIEDDIAVAQSFYCYAKACVEKYHGDMNVAGISLYSIRGNYHTRKPFQAMPSDSDVYYIQNAISWGQVWMKDQWADFKRWYEQHKDDDMFANPALPRTICRWTRSWLKFHTAYCIMEKKYFIFPYDGYSTCFSDAGVHASVSRSSSQCNLVYGPKTQFNLNPSVAYDAYMESENVAEWLGIPKEQLCVDFYNYKRNSLNQRYWLTTRALPYKIVKTFGLEMRPFEQNILYGIEGDVLHLYDTTQVAAKPETDHSGSVFRYLYGTDEDRIKVWMRNIKRILKRK